MHRATGLDVSEAKDLKPKDRVGDAKEGGVYESYLNYPSLI
jgi:hypothetical protein